MRIVCGRSYPFCVNVTVVPLYANVLGSSTTCEVWWMETFVVASRRRRESSECSARRLVWRRCVFQVITSPYLNPPPLYTTVPAGRVYSFVFFRTLPAGAVAL